MKTDDFSFYQKVLHEKSGLYLTPDKTYLLSTRLTPLCRTLGYATLDEFTNHLRATQDPVSLNMIVEAMTTNETSFFRDIKPFQNLKGKILPCLMKRRESQKKIRIWSAACSTGQEAYSIAMTLRDLGEAAQGWNFEIIGTDIADSVLEKAKAGEFNNFEIQRGLSMPQIVRNFTQKDSNWIVKDELRQFVKFKKFNLLDKPSILGMFDIVFCRNVLIYFNQETKIQVLKYLYSAMPDDGVLILGSCENIMSQQTNFHSVTGMHGVYVKKSAENLFSAA